MNGLLSTLAPAFSIAAAAIGWLTAFAVLKEARPNRMMLVLPYEGARTAWRQLLATGQHVDRVALSTAFRPLLHLGVVLLIFGSSTAYLLTMPSRPPPSLWGSLLLLSLSLRFAMLAPCPWVRFVFVGERRDGCPTTTYTGPERRQHVTE